MVGPREITPNAGSTSAARLGKLTDNSERWEIRYAIAPLFRVAGRSHCGRVAPNVCVTPAR